MRSLIYIVAVTAPVKQTSRAQNHLASATMVFVLCETCLRGLLVQAIDLSLSIWPVVRNSCRNDSEGGHALLQMTGSELKIQINLADGKSA